MDTHYYPINLVPHGVLYLWLFLLWQQIDWSTLNSLFQFPRVPRDGARASHRARAERWAQRKDHSVWIEAKLTSTTFFTCLCFHYAVFISKETWECPTSTYYTCITLHWATVWPLTANVPHSHPILSEFKHRCRWDICQVYKYMEAQCEWVMYLFNNVQII